MQNWIKQLFSSTDKLFDILNVGRLIFYTSAGLLTFYPLLMIVNLMIMTNSPTYFESLRSAAGAVTQPWLAFYGSLVVGFVVAKVAFVKIVYPLFVQESDDLKAYIPEPNNFNYLYPQLKNNHSDEDYQAWLLAEYYRYVEIAAIIPLGFYLGLGGMLGFTVLYLLVNGIPGGSVSAVYPALLATLFLSVSMAVLRYVVWPYYWCKEILAPTIAAYVRAKIALIEGLKDFEPKQGATTQSPAAPPQHDAGLNYLTGGQS